MSSGSVYRHMFDEIESDPYASPEKYLRPIAYLLLEAVEILHKQQDEHTAKTLLKIATEMAESELLDDQNE